MFSPVFETPPAKGQKGTLDIVVVPAIGFSRPSEWVDGSSRTATPWLQKLVSDVEPTTNVLEFIYQLAHQGFSVHHFSKEGVYLAEALCERYTKSRSAKVPLVLICHGTGGFVLKHALCICRQQPFRYRPVIDVVAGVIFLGAPHFVGDREGVKVAFDQLLKCQRKGIGRSMSNDRDVDYLIDICKSFELFNLKVPVLSAYESKETSTQQKFLSKLGKKGRNTVIVPKSLGLLQAHMETAVDSEMDHFDVCKVPVSSRLYAAASTLLRTVMHEAPKRISEASKPYNIPVGLKDDSLRSLTTIEGTMMEAKVTQRDSLPISSPLGLATGGSTVTSFELLPAGAAMEVEHQDPELPCFSLGNRQQIDPFLGRKDILEVIDKHLLPRPAGTIVTSVDTKPAIIEEYGQLRSFAICGFGGLGKTELAVEYAYSRRNQYEAIFWLAADDSKILASSFAQIAQMLRLEGDDADLAASRDVVMGWLAAPLRKASEPDIPENLVNWLIIFDNVDNLDVLADFWPRLGRGAVLLTSRDPSAKQNMYAKQGLNLPPLSVTDTKALMQRLTHVQADHHDQAALEAIAEKLDGHPLAVSQMSAVFRNMRLSYTGFLSYYDKEGIEQMLSRLAVSTETQGASSFATLWALDRLSDKTRALLRVICLLDPDNIPESLLIEKSGSPKLEHYPKTRDEYFVARSELIASSLITLNEEQENLSIHRLIQNTAKSLMTEDDLVESFQATSSLVISAWRFQSMKDHHSTSRFVQCERIFPSVLRLKNALEPYIKGSTGFTVDIRVAKLFNDTGWYLFERGLPEETKPFCELALLLGHQLEGALGAVANDCIRESHSFLGIALVETNEHGLSFRHKKKWLSMLEQCKTDSGLPIENYEHGYAYNEIGVAYGNNDMLQDAAEAFHRSIAIFQSLEDYDEIMLGWPEPNLGFVYWMQGKLEDAERALVEILDIYADAYGVDDTKSFKTGKILYAMGNVLEAQGRFDESLNFHQRCFEQYKKVLGLKHHRVGDVCHKLAGHCMRAGLYQEARDYLDSALKIFKSRSYLMNELARTTHRKAILYEHMGLDTMAKELLDEACNLRKRLRPGDLRLSDQLDERDFDTLVAFWSR